MQIKVFQVPFWSDSAEEAELNKFLRGQRVLSIEKQFVAAGGNSHWCFCVEYLAGSGPSKQSGEGKKKIDYREVLSDAAFARFSRFRKIRKQLAEQEGIPAYAVFTNAELAAMAQPAELTIEALKKLDGIGPKKIAKYGPHIVASTGTEDET